MTLAKYHIHSIQSIVPNSSHDSTCIQSYCCSIVIYFRQWWCSIAQRWTQILQRNDRVVLWWNWLEPVPLTSTNDNHTCSQMIRRRRHDVILAIRFTPIILPNMDGEMAMKVADRVSVTFAFPSFQQRTGECHRYSAQIQLQDNFYAKNEPCELRVLPNLRLLGNSRISKVINFL